MSRKNRTERAENRTAGGSPPVFVSNSVSRAGEVVVALNRAQGVTFRLFKDGQEYKRIGIKGSADSLRGERKGIIPVGAFGYTTIDAADWAEIKRQYGSMQIFQSGLIFAAETLNRVEDEAEEKSELRHGTEPVDPKETNTEEHTKED